MNNIPGTYHYQFLGRREFWIAVLLAMAYVVLSGLLGYLDGDGFGTWTEFSTWLQGAAVGALKIGLGLVLGAMTSGQASD